MAIMDDKNIADDKQDEVVLRGIQPRRQRCFKFFKATRLIGIFFVFFTLVGFILPRINTFDNITQIRHNGHNIFMYAILIVGAIGFGSLFLAFITKLLFLKRPPFDDWVYEIAQKRLGTDIIFYDGKHLYIQYDRSGKEVDKKEFVTEMSDKSIHYSYFYVKTDIDQGYIVVECKTRQPIPQKASFSPDDDKFWNIIPMGLTINNTTQKVSPIGWYLNDQNINEELYKTIPSTSILICGGTGCLDKDTPVLMHNTLVQ